MWFAGFRRANFNLFEKCALIQWDTLNNRQFSQPQKVIYMQQDQQIMPICFEQL